MSNLTEKPIAELLGLNFFIPSYQRGYRWTERQAEDLLDDVWDFINKPDKKPNEWYCLQPIVVKKIASQNGESEKYEVLDGQQRLTTLFLILKQLERFIESDKKSFEIEFETRNTETSNSKEFLQNIELKTLNEAITNIDYYHIYQVFQKTKDWFQAKANQGHSSISSKFITPFLESTKVIWYEVNAAKDSIEIFTRINMGKIPLTNAELIKALFLNSSNFHNSDKEKIRLRQLEIASEWDRIEYALQKDELWYFLNEDKNQLDKSILPTRIEYLFKVMESMEAPINYQDEYSTFRFFSKKFKLQSEEEIDFNWKAIKTMFQTIEEWFNDRELYHKIGYLLATDVKIEFLLKESKSKKEFKKFLDTQIKSKVNIDLSKLEYKNRAVRNVLLFQNIQTMLNFKKETSRFPFNRYKTEKWDIEHIHAIATEVNVKKENQASWLLENFVQTPLHINELLNEKIESIKSTNLPIEEKNFQEIVSYVLGEEDNNIRNLCLLDRGTNRSYKNDSFKSKRKKIIENEKKGVFIPICTKNVFMKYYSEELIHLELWNESDRESYFDNINAIIFQN
ncbi:DUF262 domain-containing protein [Flavobacterium sp. FlaQc-48]|uniref:DUF262 domain-containing protein n=1 Tax=Flavobacterium sp. FlaQc-48 TaxID=3374181 RepID=UPI0037573FEC